MLLARQCSRVRKLQSFIPRRISSNAILNGLANVDRLPQLRGRPRFPLPSTCVRILETPRDFYLALLVRAHSQNSLLYSSSFAAEYDSYS